MSDQTLEPWQKHEGCTCVECPTCAFLFHDDHTDDDGFYSCPNCAEAALRADLAETKRDRDQMLKVAGQRQEWNEENLLRAVQIERERDAIRADREDLAETLRERDEARVAALGYVAAVLEAMGDDAPSLLFDAHRYLATGRTDAAALAVPSVDARSRRRPRNAVPARRWRPQRRADDG